MTDTELVERRAVEPGRRPGTEPAHAIIWMPLTHPRRLKAQSTHIMRELVAEADNPVLPDSMARTRPEGYF